MGENCHYARVAGKKRESQVSVLNLLPKGGPRGKKEEGEKIGRPTKKAPTWA